MDIGAQISVYGLLSLWTKVEGKIGKQTLTISKFTIIFWDFPSTHNPPLLYKQFEPTKETHKKKLLTFNHQQQWKEKYPDPKKGKKKSQKDQICLFDSKAEEELILLLAKRSILSLSLSPPNFVSFLVIFLLFQLPFFFFFFFLS